MRLRLKKESVLDERELMEMHRIEHVGLWAMIVLLGASVVVQTLMGAPLVQMAGELIVIALVCVGLIIAFASRGIWDADARPSVRGNALYAAVSAAVVAAIVTAQRHSLAIGLAAGVAMLAACFALLSLMMAYVKRRQSERERALDAQTDDEIDS